LHTGTKAERKLLDRHAAGGTAYGVMKLQKLLVRNLTRHGGCAALGIFAT
jgi:hypothetical protein